MQGHKYKGNAMSEGYSFVSPANHFGVQMTSYAWLISKLYISTTGNAASAAKHFTAKQLIADFEANPTKRRI